MVRRGRGLARGRDEDDRGEPDDDDEDDDDDDDDDDEGGFLSSDLIFVGLDLLAVVVVVLVFDLVPDDDGLSSTLVVSVRVVSVAVVAVRTGRGAVEALKSSIFGQVCPSTQSNPSSTTLSKPCPSPSPCPNP